MNKRCTILRWSLDTRPRFSSKRVFSFFFFFFPAAVVDQFSHEQCIRVLFMDPQISFFNHFFIKNESHNTIHTFKNYFATMFSVFNFNKISFIQTDRKYTK